MMCRDIYPTVIINFGWTKFNTNPKNRQTSHKTNKTQKKNHTPNYHQPTPTHKSNPTKKHQMTLTTQQKHNLKKQAHHLNPQIQIGRNGVTPQQINQIKQALETHELIKIKYNHHKNQKQTLTETITQKTESTQITLIGNTLTIYRMNPDPAKRKINPDSK